LQPGTTSTATVTITKVICGVSYVRLSLNGIPSGFYSVGPKYINAIAPTSVPRQFTVYFDIPPNSTDKGYTGIYTIYANEGTYAFGELSIDIGSAEKPKLQVETATMASTAEIPEKVAASIWYSTVFFASLVALIFIGYECLLLYKKKEYKGALKRGEDEIYKALGTAPKKRAKFGRALGKRRK
jgi:hypothetical protein